MSKRIAMALLALVVLAGVAGAQDHPNFSGTWKLNSAKSNVGDYGPTSRTEVVTQDGSKFTEKVTSATQMGESDYTVTVTADGKPVTILADSPQANMGQLTLKSITAAWDGASLVITENLDYQGQVEIGAKLTYTSSADGKTMTIADHASTSMGDFDTSLVFDKQ